MFGLAAGVGAALSGAVSQATAQSRRRGMSEQERNKQAIRDYFERCWNQGDLEFGRTVVAENVNVHLPLPPGGPRGFELWKQGVGMFRAAFPDSHWDIRQIVAEGDLVSVRSVWTGTHSGDFVGIKATGRRVKAANSDYYRMRDGKFFEHWDVVDYMALLRQLGGNLDSFPPMFAASTDP